MHVYIYMYINRLLCKTNKGISIFVSYRASEQKSFEADEVDG